MEVKSRPPVAAALVVLASFGLTAAANAEYRPPVSVGDEREGALELSLHRGAAVPFELLVIETPNDCRGEIDLKLSWSETRNRVTVRIRGKNVLTPNPSVDRTAGVDFFPNPFFPEPEDIVGGRYQLWIVGGAGRLLTFYYDPATLDLVGSEFEIPKEDAGSYIPIQIPSLYLFPTPFFQPEPNGDVDFEWSFAYDAALRGDVPSLAHMYLTFPPPNLCGINPFRLDLSTLRPYISAPLAAGEARPFSDYLRGGLLFDITVEPPEFFTDPPRQTGIGSYSGGTLVGGGIPPGWTLDIDAAFMSVAPPIRPWPGQSSCGNWYPGVHTRNLNFCPAP